MFDFLRKSSDRELEEELIKQLTIANWLKLLESQYNHPDSIINIIDIQDEYQKIYNSLKGE